MNMLHWLSDLLNNLNLTCSKNMKKTEIKHSALVQAGLVVKLRY